MTVKGLRYGPSQAVFFLALQDHTWLVFTGQDKEHIVLEITGASLENRNHPQTWEFQGHLHPAGGGEGFACTGWFDFHKMRGELHLP